jgi:tetratricopeptide (TPR) repeat protein
MRRAPDRIDVRLGEIRVLQAMGQVTEAVSAAVDLTSQHPEDVEALIALAEALLANEDPAGALQALNRARQRAPQRADILKIEGAIAVDMGDYDAARRAYEDALTLDPKLMPLLLGLGQLHEVREDLQAAEAAYRAALDVLPGFTEAAVALAKLYMRQDHPNAAVNLLADVLQHNPSDVDSLLVLGQALMDDGRLEGALGALRRILAFDDKHLEALYHVGAVLAKLKRYAHALAAWKRVISIDPSSRLAQQARRHMRSAEDLNHIFRTEAA